MLWREREEIISKTAFTAFGIPYRVYREKR
jgi:hypothetical protein